MKKLTLFLLVPFVSCSLFTTSIFAASINGVFTATKSCNLYQSKNKKTNPDNLFTEIAQKYQVTEYLGNKSSPTWLRVETLSNVSPLRWISINCGSFAENEKLVKQNTKQKPVCNTEGKFDSFVLALSWQNAFCEINNRKSECQALEKNPQLAANNQFSLHGLWPNKNSCGINYGFCGKVTQKPASFCDYPALALSNETRNQLDSLMPSAQFGTCLQRHEYWKHGTCMTNSADDYFITAIHLTNQINTTEFVNDFINNNIGRSVSRWEFNRAFESSFGRNAKDKLTLICQRSMLTEIQISLPQILTQDSKLSELLQQAPRRQRGNCPNRFIIDGNNF